MPDPGRGGVDGYPGRESSEQVAFCRGYRRNIVPGMGFLPRCRSGFGRSFFSVPASCNGSRRREADGSDCGLLRDGFRAGGNLFWNGSRGNMVVMPSVA